MQKAYRRGRSVGLLNKVISLAKSTNKLSKNSCYKWSNVLCLFSQFFM